MRNTFLTMLALAIAIAFSPLSDLQAATFVNPGSQPETKNLAHVVKAKEKKKGKKKKGKKNKKNKKGKRAKSKGPGKCGTNMYYSKKTHKCMDARAKK
jgi:Skp family chaperone for outer membrane proteins